MTYIRFLTVPKNNRLTGNFYKKFLQGSSFGWKQKTINWNE